MSRISQPLPDTLRGREDDLPVRRVDIEPGTELIERSPRLLGLYRADEHDMGQDV